MNLSLVTKSNCIGEVVRGTKTQGAYYQRIWCPKQYIQHVSLSRPRALPSVVLPFTLSIVFASLLLSVSSLGGGFIQSEKPEFRVGFEGNTSVYRWANGYRELMVPSFNSSREARRSVVSGGLFSIVSFDNVPCNSDSKDVGTCYSNRECTNLGGTSSGICAGSFGTCCVVQASNGGTVTTNNTYWTNPDWPSTTSGPLSNSITVTPMTGATELYLEFIDFNIRGPSSGSCMNDTFTATQSGSTTVLPILCGNNTGQAVYLPISGTGPITLTFNLADGGNGRSRQMDDGDGRSWKIRLVQFHSTDSCAAPAGCTQVKAIKV
ncbi:hypothetical protein Ocin01_02498 [Orchesella cincta]|uniref:CUB domain-containing protein n=1 Tax=Orchesella cincta TaxID=48709 RepID=A0A1D2NFW7_ORCCI|nr:hypothetical protein Ocin01_02498 [Orchesella cincta]